MRELLKRNLGYKIISLILAILFWLWVTNQGSSKTLELDQTLTIPLVTKNLPVNSIIMTKLPSVRVRLQGVNPSVNVKDLYAYVDLTGGSPGDKDYEIKMDPIPNIKVLELTPSRINLQLDTVQEKMLPIKLNLLGSPAEGKEVGDAVLKPNVVNVRGPGKLLESVDKVLVDVNVTGATDTIQVSRPVLFRDQAGQPIYGPDPSVQTMIATPGSVDVIVPILSKGLANKMIPLKVLTKGTPVEGMAVRSIQTVPEGVQVFGNPEVLRGFDALNLGPIDISGIAADKTFEVSSDKVSLATGVTFGARTNFTIIVKVGQIAQGKTLTGVPVVIKNVTEGLELEQTSLVVDITVKALPEMLNNLTPSQINLWVDASGLTKGSYPDSKVYWQLPVGVEMVSVPKVTFSLKDKQPPKL
jgi:YbbR domain-containing protein